MILFKRRAALVVATIAWCFNVFAYGPSSDYQERLNLAFNDCSNDFILNQELVFLNKKPSLDYKELTPFFSGHFFLKYLIPPTLQTYLVKALVLFKERNGSSLLIDWKIFKHKIYKTSLEKNLSEGQKAIYAKCLSSKLIEFRDRANHNFYYTIFLPTISILKSGYGDCKVFSRLNYDLAKALKLKVRYQYSMKHSFVAYKLGGIWYGAEPQHSDGVFWKISF